MRISIAIFASLLLSLSGLSNGAHEKSEPAAATTTTTTLKLLGETKPAPAETLDALKRVQWVSRGFRDILGRGSEEFFQFRGDGEELKLKKTERRHFSVNDKRPGGQFEDQKNTLDASLTGPVLRIGNEQQTFALIPGDRLILNAVVPLADGAWYYATRTVFGNGPDAPFREEEMRFKFTDDPLQKDEGKGVLRLRSDNGDKNNVVNAIPIRFTFDKKVADGRRITVVADDDKKAKWADLVFASDGKYALILDKPNRSSKIYIADPPAATKGK